MDMGRGTQTEGKGVKTQKIEISEGGTKIGGAKCVQHVLPGRLLNRR